MSLRTEHEKEYNAWSAAKGRCYNTKGRVFKWYGGRGIQMCNRWRYSFENFFADMGVSPPGTTIDRIDNDGNYEPGNCRWIAHAEQQGNRSNCHLLTFKGETMNIAQWAKKLGINHLSIRGRLNRGFPVEQVLGVPVKLRRNKKEYQAAMALDPELKRQHDANLAKKREYNQRKKLLTATEAVTV